MFKTINYRMIFSHVDKCQVKVDIINHQVIVDGFKKSTYRVITNCSDEHEFVSIVRYMYSQGYIMILFERKRVTVLSWDEQDKLNRGINIYKDGKK